MRNYRAGFLTLAAIALGAVPAWSARVPGSSGHQWPILSTPQCFEHSNALMTNNCSGATTTRKLVLPIEANNTSSQSRAFSVRIRGNGTTTATICRGLVVNDSNGASLTSVLGTTSTALTTISLGSVTVANTNVVQVECDVPGVNGSNFAGVLRAGTNP